MNHSVSRSSSAEPLAHVYGLDVMRAFAILFVLVGHTFEHSKISPNIQAYGRLGILGVELFFVLSGFLIGGILIRMIEAGELRTLGGVFGFWKRRWMRTLPLYFVALIAFLRFDYRGRHDLLEFPTYFVFLQNFGWRIPDFFELSWSLAVEEHFYFWFPLVYLAWSTATKRRLAFVLTALTFIVIAYTFRLAHPKFSDWNAYNALIRLTVLSRLDAIMFGVLLAALKHRSPVVFGWIRRAAPLTATLFALLCMWWFMGIPHLMESRVLQVNIFTLQAALGALLLPWFDSLRTERRHNDFFSTTSRLSYSLYLGHILVIVAVNKLLVAMGAFDQTYANPFLLYPLYFILFYFVAWVTYHLVEKPFLQLRDVPLNWRTAGRASWCTLTMCAVIVSRF